MVMVKKEEPKISSYKDYSLSSSENDGGNISLIYNFYKSKYSSYSNKEEFTGYFSSNTDLTQKYERRKMELILVEAQLITILSLSLLLILNTLFSPLSLLKKKFNFIFLGGFLMFIIFLNYAKNLEVYIGFAFFLIMIIPIIIALFVYFFSELWISGPSLPLGELMRNKIISVDWVSILISIIFEILMRLNSNNN